ncbi:unnamed protein product [Calypogeia fissa]
MEVPDPPSQGGDQQQTRSKVLTLEQQRKFDELRERRLQLQIAQEVANSRKNKKRKRKGNKGNDSRPETADGASENQQDGQISVDKEDHSTTQKAAKFGSEKRHIFAVNEGKDIVGEGSFSQSSGPVGGDGHLHIVPFKAEKTPSDMVVIPAETQEVPPQKKKRKKLHWGMEIKERWERKANM